MLPCFYGITDQVFKQTKDKRAVPLYGVHVIFHVNVGICFFHLTKQFPHLQPLVFYIPFSQVSHDQKSVHSFPETAGLLYDLFPCKETVLLCNISHLDILSIALQYSQRCPQFVGNIIDRHINLFHGHVEHGAYHCLQKQGCNQEIQKSSALSPV